MSHSSISEVDRQNVLRTVTYLVVSSSFSSRVSSVELV